MRNYLKRPTIDFLFRAFIGFVAVIACAAVVSLAGCGGVPVDNGIDETQSSLCTQPIWTLAPNFVFEPATTTSNPHLPGSNANGVAGANASTRLVQAAGGIRIWYLTRNGAPGNISLGGASCVGAFVETTFNGTGRVVQSPYAMSGCQQTLINATNLDCTFSNGTHRIIPPGQWAIYKTQPGSTTAMYLDYNLYFDGPSFVIFQGLFGHL